MGKLRRGTFRSVRVRGTIPRRGWTHAHLRPPPRARSQTGRHGHRAARPYIVIPAALRRRCGLRAGDHVPLAAVPGENTLAAYSFAVVDQAMRAHTPVPGEGKRP